MSSTNPFDPTTLSLSSPDEPCPFCRISQTYSPYPPSSPPPASSPSLSPALLTPPAYVVLSTPSLIAFLDIQPLSRGHLLLCPRAHRPRLTDVTPAEAAGLGAQLRVLSAAVARATRTPDWNVVQNNGAAAAQVVGHVHYHVIPRPGLRPEARRSFTMFGRGVREELDEEEAEVLAAEVRRCVAEVVREEEEEEEKGRERGEGREGLRGKL